MREIVYALAALIGFAIVGTIDVQVAEGLLAEHAPAVIASNHLEE